MYEDDHEEEILRSDAETEASTLLSVVTTMTSRLLKRSPWWP